MRILCCLLSDQIIPNLLSVHHLLPDRLILIQSIDMEKKETASHLLQALKIGGLDYDTRCETYSLREVDQLDAIRACIRNAFRHYTDADWTVNLSGGTKPMAIAGFDFFKAVGARLVYFNNQRPSELIDMETYTSEIVSHRTSTAEFLAGYGFGMAKKMEKIVQAENRARQWWPLARSIAGTAGDGLRVAWNDETRRRFREKGGQLQPGHVQVNSEAIKEHVEVLGVDCQGKDLLGRIDKYQADFLAGGWLEAFIWGLLERHAEALGVWDVHLGIHPCKDSGADNDFDVSFMRRQRLSMVECKSGTQEHDPGADILYKVEAVIRQFRALGVSSCLATTSPLVLDEAGELKANIANRAAIYNCPVLTRNDIIQVAEGAESADLVAEMFEFV